jgi:hypothetical protein
VPEVRPVTVAEYIERPGFTWVAAIDVVGGDAVPYRKEYVIGGSPVSPATLM